MIDLVRAEILKLRTTRTFLAMAGSAFALFMVVTVLTLALSDVDTSRKVEDLLSNSGIVALFGLVLGALGMTGEYRHGSVTMTFLVSPRRYRVVAAKALATLASGALLGLLAVVLNTIVVLIWFAVSGDDLGVSVGKVIGIDAGAIALTALLTLFGFGVGVIVRNQVAAIIILLGLLFVVDPLISGFVDVLGKWSLNGLTTALTGGQSGGDNPPNLFSPVVSGLVLLLYGAILSGIGSALTARRDVG
jgi:ABC-2 type transport system permease protein